MRFLELKIPPVLLGLLIGALEWLIAWAVPTAGFTLPAGRAVTGGFAVVCTVVAVLGVVSFRQAKTTVNPLRPETASVLVVSGIYRLTRNPMYLGLLLGLLGWALYLANALAFVMPVAYVLLMNRLQILPEERALTALFGPGFTAYQSKVRRWL